MGHTRQSRPDHGLGFQVKIDKPFKVVPVSFGSGTPLTPHDLPKVTRRVVNCGMLIDSGLGEVSRGEKMAFGGTDPESYTTEYA